MHVVTHPNHPKTKYQTRIRELITKAEQVQTKFIADYQKKEPRFICLLLASKLSFLQKHIDKCFNRSALNLCQQFYFFICLGENIYFFKSVSYLINKIYKFSLLVSPKKQKQKFFQIKFIY